MLKNDKSLLVIEDDKFLQNRLREILDLYNVNIVTSAEEGLEQFKKDQIKPFLILLDIELPGINGYEACRRFREIDDYDTPIIFLSAIDNLDDRVKGYDAGGDDYITKPFNVEELKLKINKVLENRKLKEQLNQEVSDTSNAAIVAQTNAAKMGEIALFLQESRFFRDIPELCKRFFRVTQCFGLKCSVRIVAGDELIKLSDDGIINDLEQTILEKAIDAGRIFNFGKGRSIFNWGQISLLVRNIADEADNMAVLMNGFEASVEAILIERDFRMAIHQLKKNNELLQMNILEKYDQLSTELNNAFIHLGISSSLSDYELDQLGDILESNKTSIGAFFEIYKENDLKFSQLLEKIEQSYQDGKKPAEDDSILF